MVSQREQNLMSKMYRAIKNEGVIDRETLQLNCGRMSITSYNKLKSYFEEKYEGRIRYEKERRIWIDMNPDSEEQGLVIQKMLDTYQS